MKTFAECLPCLAKNGLDVARRINPQDEELQQRIIRWGLKYLSTCDCALCPPYHAGQILKNAQKESLGVCTDPYAPEKHQAVRLAEQLLEKIKSAGIYQPDNFESRTRLAVAGNILDFGVFSELDLNFAMNIITQAFTKPIDKAAVKRLHDRMENAGNIMYLLDNCGEAVFDREFLAPYREKVTLVVRGEPMLNDVTRNDLAEHGLEGFTRSVVENHSNMPGTVFELSGEEFQKAFATTDLVIAKGQGNFEGLNEQKGPFAFLFMAKCPVVTRLLQAESNSLQVKCP